MLVAKEIWSSEHLIGAMLALVDLQVSGQWAHEQHEVVCIESSSMGDASRPDRLKERLTLITPNQSVQRFNH
jgi:hypothetical protein